MSEALSALRAPIDPRRGGVLLANMLASWLDHAPSLTAAAEARDESQDSRASPQQAGLHLPAPVDAGTSSPPSGEYGAPVRLAREGAGTGLERIPDSHPRPGFGKDGNGDDAAGGLQDRAAFRIEGCHGLRRNTFLARPPPGRQAPQGQERRVAFPPSGGLLLRRGKPYHPGFGRRSTGRGEPGVSAVPRNGQRLRGDATLCRQRAAFSQAVLWGSMGWEANLGPPDARPCAGPAQEPVLCRPVRLRSLSVSA